jgi:hypothetical protein
MDDKTILDLFRDAENNAEHDSNPLNKREVTSILQKNKRRSKKDKAGRNYICGCGKNYLSYPALYTHIKNKHNNKHPEGTTLQPQSRIKPGRPPKRTDSQSKNSEDDQSHDDADPDDLSARGSDRPSKLSDNDYTPRRGTEETRRYGAQRKELPKLEDLKLVADLGCKGTCSPTKSFIREKNILTHQFMLHPIVEVISGLTNDRLEEAFHNELVCDQVFAVLLNQLAKISVQQFQSMAGLIIRALRECLNQTGYQLLQTYITQNPSEKIDLMKENADKREAHCFCSLEPPTYIGVVFDYFVREFLPCYIGGDEFNVDFVCAFLLSLNEWLLKYQLSKVRCSVLSFV